MESDVKSVVNNPSPAQPESEDERRRRINAERIVQQLNREVNGPGGKGGVLDPDHFGGSVN